jgi:hypothetical protein
MPTIQTAPLYRLVLAQLKAFCVPKGVQIVEGFLPQSDDVPRLSSGQVAPHALLEMGDIYEPPSWQSIDDSPGQLGILDFSVLVVAPSVDTLNVARDVVVAALDRYPLPGSASLHPVEGSGGIPVESFLMPFKFAKTLGFTVVVDGSQ